MVRAVAHEAMHLWRFEHDSPPARDRAAAEGHAKQYAEDFLHPSPLSTLTAHGPGPGTCVMARARAFAVSCTQPGLLSLEMTIWTKMQNRRRVVSIAGASRLMESNAYFCPPE